MGRKPGPSRVICLTRQPGIRQSLFMLRSMGSDASSCKPQPRLAQSTQRAGEPHQGGRPTFREDDSRVRDRTAARNFALLRKIALNLVARDRSTQTSLRGRCKKAAWNDAYMLQIIARQTHA